MTPSPDTDAAGDF